MGYKRGNFCVSTRIHYGIGSLEFLARLNSKNIQIIADPFMVKSGIIEQITSPIKKAKIDYTIFSDVIPDPTISVVIKGVKQALDISPDAIIALGGGSAIDTAKGILYFYTIIREKSGKNEKPTLIAIPTTSGTGSEVTDFCVITDEKARVKIPLIDKRLMPNHAILDVSLVRSVPPAITADTGLDVLTHAIEAYVSTEASDFTDALSEKAIRTVFEYLPRAFHNGGDDEARSNMHNASAMAGMAFTHTSLGINHSIAHALGGKFHVPHGRANGILLPYVIDYNSGKREVASRYAKISKLLGLNYASELYAAKELVSMIRLLLDDLAMPRGLKEMGISEREFMDNIKPLAQAAIKDPCTRTNPRIPTAEDLELILKKVYFGN